MGIERINRLYSATILLSLSVEIPYRNPVLSAFIHLNLSLKFSLPLSLNPAVAAASVAVVNPLPTPIACQLLACCFPVWLRWRNNDPSYLPVYSRFFIETLSAFVFSCCQHLYFLAPTAVDPTSTLLLARVCGVALVAIC